MHIIFKPHFFGAKNNEDETYIPLCLKAAIKSNPNSIIYFISNDKFFMDKHFITEPPRNLRCFTFNDLQDDNVDQFEETYTHLSHNPLLFEKYGILAYFYIYNLMNKININECIVVETDVLVFSDLKNIFTTLYDIKNIDVILNNNSLLTCGYATKLYLETYINSALHIYSTPAIVDCLSSIFANMNEGGICSMTINNWITNETIYDGFFTSLNNENKKIQIGELCKILKHKSIFDNVNLSVVTFENTKFDTEIIENIGEIKKIINVKNEPHFKLGNKLLKCNSAHFQGEKKSLIPKIYNEFVSKY
jgi:hypothetical protein